ncbi:hypothetical protein [Blastomonas fulva]|uniref:hypothetical protein n=1 Tax=Blastomonas fulva TaxID=1550728 RepID=UPI003F72DFD2
MNPAVPGTASTFGYLSGAPIAARNLGAWASSVFGPDNVQVVTDDYVGRKPNPVNKARVQAAVDALFPIGAEPVDHFILGFCGHGLTDENIKAISWLFTDSLELKYRVKADMFYSELLLHGIERLTLISDACREAPKDVTLQRLEPTRGIVVQGTQVDSPRFDSLVACQDTQLGFMVAEQNNPAATGKCVFSGVLADALWGNEQLAFDQDRMTVSSLAYFLLERTPKVAKSYRLKLSPDCAINPAPQTLYDKASAPAGLPALQPWPAAAQASIMGTIEKAAKTGGPPVDPLRMLQRFNTDRQFRAQLLDVKHKRTTESTPFAPLPKSSARAVAGLAAIRKRRVDDLGPDAKVIKRALVGRLKAEVAKGARSKASDDVRRSLNQLRTPDEQGRSNLIIAEAGATLWTQDGSALGNRTRAREGFLASDEPAGVSGLIELSDGVFVPWVPYRALYTVMKRSRLGEIFQAYGMPVPGMSASFKRGVGTLGSFVAGRIAQDDIGRLAADLRDTKHRDPVLGVICAYLYRAIADFDNIRRMAYFYVANDQPVPFDIVLLGEMAVTADDEGMFTVHVPEVDQGKTGNARGLPTYAFEQTPRVEGRVGGRCPWLGFGWDYVADPRPSWAVLVEGLDRLAPSVERRGFTAFPKQLGRQLARAWGLRASIRH